MELDLSSPARIPVITPPNRNTNSSREVLEIQDSQNADLLAKLISVFGSGPPTYDECTEVITEQPPHYHDISPPEGGVIEEDAIEAENKAIVEQALSSAHFNETTGFTLEYNGLPCLPNLAIVPTVNRSPAVDWKITGYSNGPCHHCCGCFSPLSIDGTGKWQTMTLKQNEQEILNFIYNPMICLCSGSKDRLVDIYIPQRNQRIGLLRQGEDNANVIDCVSKALFKVKKVEIKGNSVPFVMTVLSQEGTLIAIAQPTTVSGRREFNFNWNNFELKFCENVPASSKSVVMVAFAMWAINYKEENSRFTFLCLLIVIIFLISWFAFELMQFQLTPFRIY